MTERSQRTTMTERPCSNCGTVLPVGAKFCPSCGAATGPRGDERRVVTVLFADVVGFTPLSEDRDPEHVKNLLDRCFDRLASDVTSFGGRVDKIVGDEIMAVFGAPVAHEDDPERAVRAALQMQRNLLEHAEETGADVRMRIGINTGEVLVGALRAGGEITALGDVVNIAKRLQTAAEPGQVLVGPDTHAATKDIIDYKALGALTVKGRGATVEARIALAPLGPPGARLGRARTPLVGRKSEVAVLWHALGTAVEHDRPHFVLLVGDAGMGKTVLLEEAIEMAKVQHNALVIEGRCLPYGEANPWWPIAEALRQACGIDPEDPADVAEEKCRRAIGGILGTEDEGAEASRVADGLLYLMGYEGKLHDIDPSRARDEAIRSIQVSLAANARQRPLVIVLSELHWADQLVLDLIDSMFDRLRNLPIVLLATARPDLEERWTPRPGRHNLFVVNLDPLNRRESADFVRQLLGSEPATELVDLIVERSGGNPLFIAELIAMMGETGLGVIPGQRVEGAELPATLRGLVAARLDALERTDRAVLEDASVVGRSGPVGALAALGEARGETDSKGHLASLTHKDFFVLDEGSYEFRSDLVRDVAYETLTKGDRARRHAAVGEWLANYAKRTEREDEHLERIAHHYAQAATLVGEIGTVAGVPADVLERALAWIDRAADRAEDRETNAVTVHLMEHAIELVGVQDDKRARYLLGRARGRTAMRDMVGARADVAEVLALAETSKDRALCAEALTVRGEIEEKDGDYDASSATLEQAVEVWRGTGDRRGEAEALRLWGFTSIHRGRLDEAESAIDDALQISRQLSDRRGEAWALQNLAWAAFSRGEFAIAEERLKASAQLFHDIGDFGGFGWANGLLAYIWYFQGRLEDAGRIAEGSIEWTRETGDRWAYGMMLNLLSGVRMWQGRTRQAVELARQANRLFVEIDDAMGLALSGMHLAYGSVLIGDHEAGLELARNLIPMSGKVLAGGLGGILGASNLHSLLGDGAKAIEILDAEPETAQEPDILLARALALLVCGDGSGALEAAQQAWASGPSDPGERANYACVLGLAAAAAGDSSAAIRAADEVDAVGGTYLDRTRADLARAFANAQLEDPQAVATAFETARQTVDSSEDDLHRGLVRLAEATTATVRGAAFAPNAQAINDARDQLESIGVAWRPWENAFRLAATGGRSEVVAAPSVE